MRVLHAVTDYLPNIFSGIGVFTENLVEAQQRAGDQVSVVTFWSAIDGDNVLEENSVVEWPEVGHLDDPRLFSILFLNIDVAALLDKIDPNQIDVVHIHDYFGALGAVQWAKRNQLPILFTKHFLDLSRPTNLRDRFRYEVETWCLSQADQISCVSEFLAQTLISRYPDCGTKIRSIAGASLTPSEYAASTRSVKDPWKIVLAGRVKHIKGWDIALQVLQLIDERFHLVIAGDGPDLDAAKRMAERLNVCARVRFTGHLDRSDLLSEYATSTYGLFMSREEAYGLALAEAMAAGCVCIASRVGGIPEQIRHGHSGYLVDVDDYRSAAEILTDLVDRPEEVTRVREHALGASHGNTWDLVAAKTRQAYQDAVETFASATRI